MNFTKRIKRSLLRHVVYVIEHSAEFAISPKYFRRIRKWPLRLILIILFNMQHEDLADALLQSLPMNERLKSSDVSAFIQQRSHLKPEALRYIFDHVLADICQMGTQKTYHGYFLVAGDGSDISMPTEVIPSAVNEKASRKVQHHMEHLNALYDVKNERYVAFSTLPKLECKERDELLDLADALANQENLPYKPENTILICDRGYEGCHVFACLVKSGYHFVIRAKGPKSNGILKGLNFEDIPEKSGTDTTVRLKVRRNKDGIYKHTVSKGWNSDTDMILSLRVVIKELPNGDFEYLFTNLPQDKFSAGQIAHIYRIRWNIETSFRYLKYGIGGLVFHAKALRNQLMELYASMALYNCIAAIINHIEVPRNGRKYRYKINFNAAVRPCTDYLLFSDENHAGELEEFLKKRLVPIQPNRKFKRKRLPKKRGKGFHNRV